jgi:hypothetical protein
VKRKESEVLQQGGLLKCLKPANIEEETPCRNIQRSCQRTSHPAIELQPAFWMMSPVNGCQLFLKTGKFLLINNRPVQVTDVDFPFDGHGRNFNKVF